MCSISTIPADILLEFFSHLDATSLCQACLTCKQWYQIISQTQTLWRLQYLKITDIDDRYHVLKARSEGKSWKDAFKKNYSKLYIKQMWKEGRFSNPKNFCELPTRVLCPMDATTWGELFQRELER